MNELARKDLFVCLGIWLALEVVCFAILPAFRLSYPRAELQNWFLLSLMLGIGGACIFAGSTQLADFFRSNKVGLKNQFFQSLLVGLIAWIGLLGISFPLLVMSIQIFSQLLGLLKN